MGAVVVTSVSPLLVEHAALWFVGIRVAGHSAQEALSITGVGSRLAGPTVLQLQSCLPHPRPPSNPPELETCGRGGAWGLPGAQDFWADQALIKIFGIEEVIS